MIGEIKTKPSSKEYRLGYDRIFKKGKGKHIRRGKGRGVKRG